MRAVEMALRPASAAPGGAPRLRLSKAVIAPASRRTDERVSPGWRSRGQAVTSPSARLRAPLNESRACSSRRVDKLARAGICGSTRRDPPSDALAAAQPRLRASRITYQDCRDDRPARAPRRDPRPKKATATGSAAKTSTPDPSPNPPKPVLESHPPEETALDAIEDREHPVAALEPFALSMSQPLLSFASVEPPDEARDLVIVVHRDELTDVRGRKRTQDEVLRFDDHAGKSDGPAALAVWTSAVRVDRARARCPLPVRAGASAFEYRPAVLQTTALRRHRKPAPRRRDGSISIDAGAVRAPDEPFRTVPRCPSRSSSGVSTTAAFGRTQQ
jgi:hypothetical protein